jgi:cytochrome P450
MTTEQAERSTYRRVEGGDGAQLQTHPAEIFGRMLAEAPVHKGRGRRFGDLEFPPLWPDFEGDTYLVLSFDGIMKLLRSPHVSSDIHQQGAEMVVGRSLFGMDPPQQTEMRRLLFAGFTPTQVQRWEDIAMRPAAVAITGSLVGRDRFDLVRDVIESYPYRVITKILGVPDDVGPWATDKAVDLVRVVSDPQAAFVASAELAAYFTKVVKEKRITPGDDFISVLLHAEVEDGRPLQTDELVNFIRHLFLAGVETTFRAGSNTMTHLMTNPHCWTAVMADAFRLHRPTKTTLSFSAGPHTCIGMHLGRREMTILIEELVARLPRMVLDTEQPAPVIEGWMLRGASHLPVVADGSGSR